MSKLANILKWVDIVRVVLPPTLIVAGVPADKVVAIANTVVDAEAALGPGTGAEKLQHVIQGLQDGMKASGASDETIATVTDAAVAGINASIAITKDVQRLKAKDIKL